MPCSPVFLEIGIVSFPFASSFIIMVTVSSKLDSIPHRCQYCGILTGEVADRSIKLLSIAKLPYEHATDGISYTFSIIPGALGKGEQNRVGNLTSMMDGYFLDGGHHVNINVLDRDMLLDAMERPEEYPQLTIRVSGYAVNFVKLNCEQQLDVINRTFYRVI